MHKSNLKNIIEYYRNKIKNTYNERSFWCQNWTKQKIKELQTTSLYGIMVDMYDRKNITEEIFIKQNENPFKLKLSGFQNRFKEENSILKLYTVCYIFSKPGYFK